MIAPASRRRWLKLLIASAFVGALAGFLASGGAGYLTLDNAKQHASSCGRSPMRTISRRSRCPS